VSADIDFQVRPNKSIERKLIFGALLQLASRFPLKDYSYIGLGSYWFSDFAMAHKKLDIVDLISIEHSSKHAPRAKANAPYAGVEVHEGQSTVVLPKILGSRSRVIVWLDYDRGVDRTSLADMELLSERLDGGSILLATLNAHAGSLENGREERFRELFPEIPTPLPKNFFQRPATHFPANLAHLVFERLRRNVSRRIDHEFVPMFNFYYADDAPMVTVGGMVLTTRERESFENSGVLDAPGATASVQYAIDAPALTRREKLVFDRLCPRNNAAASREDLTGAGLPSLATDNDLEVYNGLLSRYARIYKHYPMYFELDA
jgi:hypothetical protein